MTDIFHIHKSIRLNCNLMRIKIMTNIAIVMANMRTAVVRYVRIEILTEYFGFLTVNAD